MQMLLYAIQYASAVLTRLLDFQVFQGFQVRIVMSVWSLLQPVFYCVGSAALIFYFTQI